MSETKSPAMRLLEAKERFNAERKKAMNERYGKVAEAKREYQSVQRTVRYERDREPKSLKIPGIVMLVSFLWMVGALVAAINGVSLLNGVLGGISLLCIPVFIISALVFFARAIDL